MLDVSAGASHSVH